MGKGSSSQDLAGALLIIFKTNSSVTGSKISKGSPRKRALSELIALSSYCMSLGTILID